MNKRKEAELNKMFREMTKDEIWQAFCFCCDLAGLCEEIKILIDKEVDRRRDNGEL